MEEPSGKSIRKEEKEKIGMAENPPDGFAACPYCVDRRGRRRHRRRRLVRLAVYAGTEAAEEKEKILIYRAVPDKSEFHPRPTFYLPDRGLPSCGDGETVL